jgi:hypothetical protein
VADATDERQARQRERVEAEGPLARSRPLGPRVYRVETPRGYFVAAVTVGEVLGDAVGDARDIPSRVVREVPRGQRIVTVPVPSFRHLINTVRLVVALATLDCGVVFLCRSEHLAALVALLLGAENSTAWAAGLSQFLGAHDARAREAR